MQNRTYIETDRSNIIIFTKQFYAYQCCVRIHARPVLIAVLVFDGVRGPTATGERMPNGTLSVITLLVRCLGKDKELEL